MIIKTKLLAITFAALMLAGGLAFLIPADENGLEAAVGDGGTYSYTITYDSSVMSTTSAAISVADMTPISHTNTGVLEGMNAGSWTWDTTTGVGPFNSFYGAFDINNGNAFVGILDPYDLGSLLDGTTLASLGGSYNIMWVLPTVYWKVADGNITLTNDSTSGGTAYAHTINGHVYKYIAIGVYEATSDNNSNPTKLSSETGKNPLVNKTRAQFRSLADAYTMDSSLGSNAYSMLWNFYQWELYKYCSLAVMEDFNSQNIVGWGHTYGSTYSFNTGATDSLGPYTGKVSANVNPDGNVSVKLFLENSWGGVNEFVDGAVFRGASVYIDTSSVPTDSTTTGGNVSQNYLTMPTSGGYPTAISTDAATWGWGVGSSYSGSETTGLADRTTPGTSSTENDLLCVGGMSNTDATISVFAGVSCAYSGYTLTASSAYIGSRLALVFDKGPVFSVNATIQSNNTDYGTVSTASITDIEPGTAVTVSQNGLTLTIGAFGSSVATPTTADAQYTYSFNGWYVNNVALETGDTIDEDVTIEARFTATLNTYTVTISPNDPTYGSLSSSSVGSVPYGTHLSILDNVITINGTDVTATPADATAQYTFSFGSWSVADDTEVTGDLAVTAVFSATVNTYTVTIESNDVDKGTVSPTTISDVPYGTEITVDGSKISVGAVEVTTTAASGFELKNWSVRTGDTITGDTTITATFDEPKDVNNILLKLIPLILIIALVVLAATAMFSFNGDGQQLIRFIIVLGISVVLITTVLIPAVGGI